MRLTVRIISSLFSGYVVFCVLNLIFGNSGLIAMKRLEEIKSELEENILRIESNHEELTREFEGLRSSSDRIALEARNLGYFEKDEGVILVEGFSLKNKPYTLGKLVNVEVDKSSKKPLFRGISGGTIIFALIIVFISSKNNENSKKRRL